MLGNQEQWQRLDDPILDAHASASLVTDAFMRQLPPFQVKRTHGYFQVCSLRNATAVYGGRIYAFVYFVEFC